MLIALCATADATQIVARDLAGLAERADAILTLEVIDSTCEQEGQRVVTRTRARVLETWNGDLVPGEIIDVVTPGGRIGDTVTRAVGAETFEAGENALLFARRRGDGTWVSSVLSWSKFRILTIEGVRFAERDIRGLTLIGPAGGPVESAQQQFALADIEARVRAAVRRTRP